MSQRVFENSRVVHELLSSEGSILYSQYLLEMPSSSVSKSGLLWQKALFDAEYNDMFLKASDETRKTDSIRQRNADLLPLLQSWREGNEQEQRDTLEHLRKALDEDRFSSRKLFP